MNLDYSRSRRGKIPSIHTHSHAVTGQSPQRFSVAKPKSKPLPAHPGRDAHGGETLVVAQMVDISD